jgi:DNA-binding IclR family transcriptional regulator
MTTEPNTSVDQIFETLDLLAGGKDPLGVADLARELSLTTSTAHRLLVTLSDAGFADRDTSGAKYELGFHAHALAHAVFRQHPLRQAALPALARVASESGETTSLDVRVGWMTVRMASVEGWREIHAATRLGEIAQLGEHASGRAVLAGIGGESVARYLDWEAGRSAGRAGARSRSREIRAALTEIADRGFAHETASEGVGAQLAFPIRAGGGAPAALVVEGSGPAAAAGRTLVKRCLKVVGDLERLLAAEPQLARGPFDHLDPDLVAGWL